MGRWFLFDFKLEKKQGLGTNIIKNVKLPKNELENFVTVYSYLKNRKIINDDNNLNDSFFKECNKSETIIDETIIEEKCYEENRICRLFENLTFLK